MSTSEVKKSLRTPYALNLLVIKINLQMKRQIKLILHY